MIFYSIKKTYWGWFSINQCEISLQYVHFIGNLYLITLNNANIGKEWSYFFWFEMMNFVGLNFEVTGKLALKTNFWPAFKDDCHMVGHGFHPGLDPITCKNAVFFIDYREYLLRFTMILGFFFRNHSLNKMLHEWRRAAAISREEYDQSLAQSQEHYQRNQLRHCFSNWHDLYLTERAMTATNQKLTRCFIA